MEVRVRAIETTWHGIRFRSKLEARWAVIFECLGIDWEYEPEGFVLDDGTCYLPDFLLHGVVGENGCLPKKWWDQFGPEAYAGDRCDAVEGDLYIEVKGRWTRKDLGKVREFARHRPIYCVGNIPQCDRAGHVFGEVERQAFANASPNFSFETVDGESYGGVLGVNHYGDVELFSDPTEDSNDCWRAVNEMAYETASKPRFDHGDVPDEKSIEYCRSLIADAHKKYITVRDDVNEKLECLTDEDMEYLRGVTERLSGIKARLGLTNIRVEAFNTDENESCVELKTMNGWGSLRGSTWYRIARTNRKGELTFATHGEHRERLNGAKCAAASEHDMYLSAYDNAPLIEKAVPVLDAIAFVASIDRW